MKTLSTILAAAFIAGSCTLAMAQGGGGGAGGGTGKPGEPARANDENPTGPNASPKAGNPEGASPAAQRSGTGMQTAPTGMQTAPTGMSTTPNSANTGTAPAAGIDTVGPDKKKPGSGN
jgi:hypothetical protein